MHLTDPPSSLIDWKSTKQLANHSSCSSPPTWGGTHTQTHTPSVLTSIQQELYEHQVSLFALANKKAWGKFNVPVY